MTSRMRSAIARVRELFRHRSHSTADRDEEFAFHLDMETEENVRRGMTHDDARRAALLRFGGTQRFREETGDARGVVAIDNLVRDARFALRRLRRAPGFALGVIATLGIGIGAAVGIGTIVHGVLFRDLPYDDPDRLVRVGFITPGIPDAGDLHSSATYFHFATGARSFSELGAWFTSDAFNVTDGDAPERVTVALMTPNTFTMLGVRPLIGELFQPGDTSWYNDRAAILLSENFWRRRYGADPSIISRRIDINRGARAVIGVLPASFAFPTPSVDIYYPATVPLNRPDITARGFNVIGRLRVGTTAAAAESELNTLIPGLAERFPAITPEILQRSQARTTIQTLQAAMVAPVRPQLVLLGMLVAIVLLVATTNVLNLFLLRAERARREIAIALSLGASRIALAQRFIMEGVVLGLVSAGIALPAAALALSTKFGFTERGVPRLHEVSFSSVTVALVVGGAVVIGAGVGLIGLTRTGTAGLFDFLRTSTATASRTWQRARNGLVSVQVAITLMLLVAASLLGRSFWNLRNARIGFEPAQAMTFQVSLPWGPDGYVAYTKAAAFQAALTERLEALPGVTSVGVASHLPLAGRGEPALDMQLQAIGVEGRATVTATGALASPDYFGTMRMPLRTGRGFSSGDLRGTPAVVVSERLATMLFGTTDVVGRRIQRMGRGQAPSTTFAIVGVVGDVHWERIEDGYVPMLYFPLLGDSDGLPDDSIHVPYRPMDVRYAIRGPQLPTGAAIQRILTELDARVPAAEVRTLGALVDDATARVRLTMLLIAIAGAAALVLAVVGVYSVIAYAANERLREFGIRLALGAAPARVGRMVLGDGLRFVGMGTLVGLLAAFATTRFLRALLYEVEPTSLVEFGAATGVLVFVTLCATLLPARRAARTPPAVVLRG